MLLLALLVAGLGLSFVAAPARAASGVVRFYLFYAADCSKCQAIRAEFLPSLLQPYGSRIEVRSLDVSDPAVMQQLISLEAQFGEEALQALQLRPWGMGTEPGWIGIRIDELTGRRIIAMPRTPS
jgi:hypothetical protein